MDEMIKIWPLPFPRKENPNMEKAWSIGQSCCSMTSKGIIDWFLDSSRAWRFFPRAFAYPTKNHARLYPVDKPIKSLSISVRLLFLFCSRVFISTSYEKRKVWERFCLWPFKAERVTGTLSLFSLAITTLSSKTQVKISLPKQPTVHFDKHLPTLRVTSI